MSLRFRIKRFLLKSFLLFLAIIQEAIKLVREFVSTMTVFFLTLLKEHKSKVFLVFLFLCFPKLMFCLFLWRYGLWQLFLIHPALKSYRSIFWRYERRVRLFFQDKKEAIIFFFDYRYYIVLFKFLRFIGYFLLNLFLLFLLCCCIIYFVSQFTVWTLFNDWFIRFFFNLV